jgi:hypothetical protein
MALHIPQSNGDKNNFILPLQETLFSANAPSALL